MNLDKIGKCLEQILNIGIDFEDVKNSPILKEFEQILSDDTLNTTNSLNDFEKTILNV